ncbi:hypothetical protein BaRGS_00020297, partial [Batillaria attramentaria]
SAVRERRRVSIPYHVHALQFPTLQVRETSGQVEASPVNTARVDDVYQLHQLLAQGGYSTVYLARERGRQCNEAVAVKLMRKDKCGPDMALTELHVLAMAIDCRFIVEIRDCFQTSTHHGLVLTFASGGTLHTRVNRIGHCCELMARFYAAEIAEGLFFLHDLAVIHRDLNMDNILLTDSGHLQLCDFGLSHVGTVGDDVLCQPWDCPAAPQLPAPELLSGDWYSKTVDWWSYGVMLYRMLCGSYPFAQRGSQERCTPDVMSVLVYKLEPFPTFISPQAKTFLQELLIRDGKRRLGHGASERIDICKVSFFSTINWQHVRDQTLPPPSTTSIIIRKPGLSVFTRSFTA